MWVVGAFYLFLAFAAIVLRLPIQIAIWNNVTYSFGTKKIKPAMNMFKPTKAKSVREYIDALESGRER